MNILIVLGVIVFAIGAAFISKLYKYLMNKKIANAETSDAKIISRKKAVDRHGDTKYYATFEFINRDTLELEVPLLVYELAKQKITGKLIHTSHTFVKFIRESGAHINNQFKKTY